MLLLGLMLISFGIGGRLKSFLDLIMWVGFHSVLMSSIMLTALEEAQTLSIELVYGMAGAGYLFGLFWQIVLSGKFNNIFSPKEAGKGELFEAVRDTLFLLGGLMFAAAAGSMLVVIPFVGTVLARWYFEFKNRQVERKTTS